MNDKLVDIEVVKGIEGFSLALMNPNGGYRIAGSKPWGGGTTVHKFTVSVNELVKHAEENSYTPNTTT